MLRVSKNGNELDDAACSIVMIIFLGKTL